MTLKGQEALSVQLLYFRGLGECRSSRWVADPDAHCAQAKAAGAEIVRGPYANDGYPGRAYDARDPEGNVWNFGSYDPWADA